MFVKSSTLVAVVAVILNTAAALPTAEERDLSNLHIIVRGENNTYARSTEREDYFRAHPPSVEKRSTAFVQACTTTQCTNCRTVFNGDFDSNSPCLAAFNTACLIIENLQDANVEFWNHGGCNGDNTVYRGCEPSPAYVPAPGTNSIGVHVGC